MVYQYFSQNLPVFNQNGNKKKERRNCFFPWCRWKQHAVLLCPKFRFDFHLVFDNLLIWLGRRLRSLFKVWVLKLSGTQNHSVLKMISVIEMIDKTCHIMLPSIPPESFSRASLVTSTEWSIDRLVASLDCYYVWIHHSYDVIIFIVQNEKQGFCQLNISWEFDKLESARERSVSLTLEWDLSKLI